MLPDGSRRASSVSRPDGRTGVEVQQRATGLLQCTDEDRVRRGATSVRPVEAHGFVALALDMPVAEAGSRLAALVDGCGLDQQGRCELGDLLVRAHGRPVLVVGARCA